MILPILQFIPIRLFPWGVQPTSVTPQASALIKKELWQAKNKACLICSQHPEEVPTIFIKIAFGWQRIKYSDLCKAFEAIKEIIYDTRASKIYIANIHEIAKNKISERFWLALLQHAKNRRELPDETYISGEWNK